MQNTIALQDWLRIMDAEYLSSFVHDGGASIKFAVTPEELRGELSTRLRALCKERDYLLVELNAASMQDPDPSAKLSDAFGAAGMRAHMPQDIFFSMARQVPWRLVTRRMILRLASEHGWQTDGVFYGSDDFLDAIKRANDLAESAFVHTALLSRIESSASLNRQMNKDFRVAMTHLCLNEDSRSDRYTGQPLLDWLTGRNTRISNVQPFFIHTPINRTTARYFIESALYWIQYVGYAGTVILFDNSRVMLAHDPHDGLRYYKRNMAVEHYELLRQFVDGVDRLTGTLLVVTPDVNFLDEGNKSRGYGIYPALRTRVMADVRDRNHANPVASLVRLS